MSYRIGRKLGLNHRLDYQLQWTKDITDANAKGTQRATTIQYQYMYNLKKQRSIDLTLFSGVNNQYALSMWNPTGMTGSQDFTFNQLYMGRSETNGIWSNQVQNGHGLIATPTFQNFNYRLVSARLEYTLPTDYNLKVYGATAWGVNKVSSFDLLSSFVPSNIDASLKNNTTFMWSTGIHFTVGPNLAEVFVPLLSSQNIIDSQKAHGIKWQQSFTIKFNLTSLNPFEMVGKALSKTE
jgi:hypothetical protein